MSLLKIEAASPVHSRGAATVVTDMVAAFFRGKRMILAGVLAFLLLFTAILLLGQKTYESRMTFLVRDEGSAFPTASFEEHSENPSGSPTDTQIGTEIELLSGMELHRQVIAAMHPGLSSTEIDHRLLGFDQGLQVVPIPKTNLIAVAYTAESREEANSTLATLSRLYLAYRSRIRGNEGAYAFFDQQAKRYYDKLQVDQKELTDFDQKNQVTLMNEEKDVVVHRLADARGLLYENEAAIGEAGKKIQTIQVARETLPPRVMTQHRDVSDQAGSDHLNSILVDLQNERVGLLTKYHSTDRHVQELDDKIANIREALKRSQQAKTTEEQTDLNPLRQSVEADLEQLKVHSAGLQARQRSLVEQVNAYDSKLQQLNQITGEYEDLTRKVKEDENSYEQYFKKREDASINRTLDNEKIANVRQVSGPAVIPVSKMQVLFGMVCVYIIGTLILVGAGILAGLWSPRFHSPGELEAAVGSPVLATIPMLAGQGRDKISPRLTITSPSIAHRVRNPSTGGSPESVLLQDMNEPRQDWAMGQLSRYDARIHSDGSQAGGVYLPLIERLRRRAPSNPGVGSVFACTACNSGEGVSHFVRGLGAELTDYTGKRVAIVNALDSYESAMERNEMTPMESLSKAPKSGEEFLKQWFQKLRETHDYVLIDCPALSASHAAAVFGPHSDGLLLVVAAGNATRSQLRGALAMLSVASVSVIGLALNKRCYPIPAAIYNLL